MNILAIDTTSTGLSIALIKGDETFSHTTQIGKSGHSATLMPQIDDMLKSRGVDVKNLDADIQGAILAFALFLAVVVAVNIVFGTIDAIVTDHSPHAVEEKDREYIYAPSGFPGLETSLGVMLTDLYHTGKLDLPTIISKMTVEPAKCFGLACGTLAKGAAADVVVIDPDLEWTVDAAKFYTKGSHSPFVGKQMKGKAVLTLVDGEVAMKDGIVE